MRGSWVLAGLDIDTDRPTQLASKDRDYNCFLIGR